jgi:DNA repair exonuclease SbcCD ATPase subunit
VLTQLFELFGDRVKIEEAAKQAIPDLREVKKLKSYIERNQKELKKIPISKERLLDKVEKGIIEDDDLSERWNKLKEREILLKAEIESFQSKLQSIPTQDEISRTAQIMQRVKESFFQSQAHLKEMSFEDKRALLQNLFGGTDKDGKRYGVYVEKLKKKGLWVYTIRGAFIEEVGRLDQNKQNMQPKCDAHHRLRFY